jgi:hypothetical protein
VRDRLFDNFKVSFDLKRKPYNLRARAARAFDPRVDNGDPQMATQSSWYLVFRMHTASVSQASGTRMCGSHLLVRQMLYASEI